MRVYKTTLIFILIISCQFLVYTLPALKQAFWMMNFLAFLLLPFHHLLRVKQHFTQPFTWLFIPMLLFNVFLVVKGVLSPNGQTVQSIVGNPAFTMYHLLPFFALVSISKLLPRLLLQSFQITIILSLLYAVLFQSVSLTSGCLYFFIAVYPYINNHKLRLVFASSVVILGLMASLMYGVRMLFIAVLFFAGVVLVNKYSPTFAVFRRRIRLICYVLIFTPFTLFLIAISTGYSIFNISEEFQFLADSDSGSNDTRTFVWTETLHDLVRNNAIYTGKGMSGKIKTELPSFVDPTVKNGERLFVESAFLDNIRRGGILLTLLNVSLLVVAVRYTLKNSRNSFLLFVASGLSFFFLLSFISHVASMSHEFFIFWVFLGLTASKYWNGLTDKEIYNSIRGVKKKVV